MSEQSIKNEVSIKNKMSIKNEGSIPLPTWVAVESVLRELQSE